MLETTKHGQVVELKLARPPVNALDPGLIAALDAAVAALPQSGARAAIISGREGVFSAGLDVPALLLLDRANMQALWRGFFALLRRIAQSPVPIVAAITGHSPAGGAVVSLFCDARIMAAGEFAIGLNEVQVGIPLPKLIYAALERLVGARQAERLGVGGVMLDPAQALAVGLVDALEPPAQVVPRAVAWCEQLLALPPRAMASTRAMARQRLLDVFDLRDDAMVERAVDAWFDDETQTTLEALAAKLGKRT